MKFQSQNSVICFIYSYQKMHTLCGGRNRLCLTTTQVKYLKDCDFVSQFQKECQKTCAQIYTIELSFQKDHFLNLLKTISINSSKNQYNVAYSSIDWIDFNFVVYGEKIESIISVLKQPLETIQNQYISQLNIVVLWLIFQHRKMQKTVAWSFLFFSLNKLYYIKSFKTVITNIINNQNLLKLMSQNAKFKVKQFQWFQMETKVREIIQQIVGPLQKRILQSSSILNKVKGNQLQDESKINQIALMIANDPKVFQTGIFATVDKKFEEQYKLIEQLSRQIDQQNKYVEQKFKIMDLRMEQTNVVLMNMASLKERVSKQMQIQNDNINLLKSNIELMLDDLNKDIRQTRQAALQNLQDCQKKDLLLQQDIRKVKQNILTIQDNIQIHHQMHRQKSILLEGIDKSICNNTSSIQQLQQTKDLTKKLMEVVQDMDNQLNKGLFRIDTMGPLITQAQISDCLSSILPSKFKKKITIFQHKKYFSLNQQVLEKDYKKAKNVFDGLKLIEAMQKKSTKQIVQLKRKKLLQMGIDIDHLTYQQRQKYYSQISLDQQFYIDQQETQVNQKIDEEEIKKILQKFLQKYMAGFKDQIKIQIQDNKQYLYGIQEQIRFQISKFQKRVGDTHKQCSAFHTEHLMEIKFHADYSKSLDQKINNVKVKVKQTFDLQRMFYNFCSLINHLQIQDQIDKQNISLMGVQQNNTSQDITRLKQRNSVVALQNKCFSCNGFPATTISAFKMACLAYNPSSIKIDSKDYKRQELLQFTTNMLQNIKKSIQEQILQQKPVETIKKMSDSRQLKQFESHTVTIQDPQERSLAAFFRSKQIQTQQTQNIRKSSKNKFRKTRKSLNTTFSSSNTKQKSSLKSQLRQDMLNTSAIFNSIKKKNLSFLNI